jgi:hypothetical protein
VLTTQEHKSGRGQLDYPDRIALDSIYEGKYRNAKELE